MTVHCLFLHICDMSCLMGTIYQLRSMACLVLQAYMTESSSACQSRCHSLISPDSGTELSLSCSGLLLQLPYVCSYTNKPARGYAYRCPAAASESAEPSETSEWAAYDGYIVKLKNDRPASRMSLFYTGVQKVDDGIYLADTFEDALNISEPDNIQYIGRSHSPQVCSQSRSRLG